MLRIDRSQPSFVAKAIGVMTGRLVPDPDGRSGTIITRSKTKIRVSSIMHGVVKTMMSDPSLFAKELDILVWPKTIAKELVVTIIRVEEAAENNPDRDLFLIQGMSLYNPPEKPSVRIGIRCNTSDKKNKSKFDKFWITLQGSLKDDRKSTVYQIFAKRKGKKLFIIESTPHKRTGSRWTLESVPKEVVMKG